MAGTVQWRVQTMVEQVMPGQEHFAVLVLKAAVQVILVAIPTRLEVDSGHSEAGMAFRQASRISYPNDRDGPEKITMVYAILANKLCVVRDDLQFRGCRREDGVQCDPLLHAG
eukprot:scaffold2094_cov239-Pinguiococcus_pyrenoidosus.AAC.15